MMSMVLGLGAGVATPVALASAEAMKHTAVSRETTRRIDTPSMERRHRAAGDRGVSRKLTAKAMSRFDSRYNGCCLVFGASHARGIDAASSRPALAMTTVCNAPPNAR